MTSQCWSEYESLIRFYFFDLKLWGTCTLPLVPHINQLNGQRQQQHWGRDGRQLKAEIWNFNHESWNWIQDFCLKLLPLCLGYKAAVDRSADLRGGLVHVWAHVTGLGPHMQLIASWGHLVFSNTIQRKLFVLQFWAPHAEDKKSKCKLTRGALSLVSDCERGLW